MRSSFVSPPSSGPGGRRGSASPCSSGWRGGAAPPPRGAARARRTATAYPRFVKVQDGVDLVTGGFPEGIDAERAFTTIERFPVVEEWARTDVVANAGILP